MEKGGLGFPGVPSPREKTLADLSEVLVGIHYEEAGFEGALDTMRSTFSPLIEAMETSFMAKGIAKRTTTISEPSQKRNKSSSKSVEENIPPLALNLRVQSLSRPVRKAFVRRSTRTNSSLNTSRPEISPTKSYSFGGSGGSPALATSIPSITGT
ncbi:hypothetical protein H0H81_004071 [Sphagnurus paluster]|uniref:Uncharacterized protein n=1 Tax=Sphagnurus paluster TaxID=117069 RepID=A0A9P7FY08_9AGAR|nr:hypothetical protein H0H81_004071 [Sphagnurus paluster]